MLWNRERDKQKTMHTISIENNNQLNTKKHEQK